MPVVDKSLVEVLAAGSQQRTFPLQGGGGLTLSPGSTIEVERSGSLVTLSLLQGEASIDSADRNLTVVAGDARINTQSGSVISVRRNADDVDVKVDRGSANVSSPAGPSQLAENQRATVPLHAAISAAPTDAVVHRARDRALPPRPRKSPQASLAKLANVAEWFTHYPADGPGAIALLRKQGVDKAIAQAHSAAELSAIAELMSGDQGAVIQADERLLHDYPNDQRAALAARELGRIYEARGNAARAKEYREKGEALTKSATTGGDALFCNMIRHETDKTKAALMAKEYLDKYPDGECRDEFERQVQAEASAPPSPVPSSSASPSAPPPVPGGDPADVGTATPAASSAPKAPPSP
jgi:TolA-binding protein